MKIKALIAVFALAALPLTPTWGSDAKSDAAERVADSARVLNEIMAAPDKGIPRDLLSKAHCVAVVPSLKKAGFIVGGQYGKGVVACRSNAGKGWTGPSTIRIEGGSWGLQIGGASTDVVLLVMDQNGAEKLMSSQFTLGGDMTAAAGPVGRSAQAQTDAMMNAKILAYSRSRGAFAGIVLQGSTLRPDDSDNQALYGKAVTHKDILEGKVPAPAAAADLIRTLNKYSSAEM